MTSLINNTHEYVYTIIRLVYSSRNKQVTQLSQRDRAAMCGLEAKHAVRKVVDFLAIIELMSLGVTAEALRANIDWKSPFLKGVGHFGPKFQVEGDVSYQPFVHG